MSTAALSHLTPRASPCLGTTGDWEPFSFLWWMGGEAELMAWLWDSKTLFCIFPPSLCLKNAFSFSLCLHSPPLPQFAQEIIRQSNEK